METFTDEKGDVPAGVSEPFEATLDDLDPHPAHTDIYGRADAGLTNNLLQYGQQVPIKIDQEDRVLSGNRRVEAARSLGWESITAQEVEVEGESEARRVVLLFNAYRAEKPWVLRYREACEYAALVRDGTMDREDLLELAREGAETVEDMTGPQLLAAKAVGMSRRTFQAGRYVFEENRCESDIVHDVHDDRVSEEQAELLKAQLEAWRDEVRSAKASPNTAERKMRKALEEAREQHKVGEEACREQQWKEDVGTIRYRAKALADQIEEAVAEAQDLGLEDTSALEPVVDDLRRARLALADLGYDEDDNEPDPDGDGGKATPIEVDPERLGLHVKKVRAVGGNGVTFGRDWSAAVGTSDGTLVLLAPPLTDTPVLPRPVAPESLSFIEKSLREFEDEDARLWLDTRDNGDKELVIGVEGKSTVRCLLDAPYRNERGWLPDAGVEQLRAAVDAPGKRVDPDHLDLLSKRSNGRWEITRLWLTVPPDADAVSGLSFSWPTPPHFRSHLGPVGGWVDVGTAVPHQAPHALHFPPKHFARLVKLRRGAEVEVLPERRLLVLRRDGYLYVLRGHRWGEESGEVWPLQRAA